jgi:hypothetical protein
MHVEHGGSFDVGYQLMRACGLGFGHEQFGD